MRNKKYKNIKTKIKNIKNICVYLLKVHVFLEYINRLKKQVICVGRMIIQLGVEHPSICQPTLVGCFAIPPKRFGRRWTGSRGCARRNTALDPCRRAAADWGCGSAGPRGPSSRPVAAAPSRVPVRGTTWTAWGRSWCCRYTSGRPGTGGTGRVPRILVWIFYAGARCSGSTAMHWAAPAAVSRTCLVSIGRRPCSDRGHTFCFGARTKKTGIESKSNSHGRAQWRLYVSAGALGGNLLSKSCSVTPDHGRWATITAGVPLFNKYLWLLIFHVEGGGRLNFIKPTIGHFNDSIENIKITLWLYYFRYLLGTCMM